MRYEYEILNLNCAHCANKIEEKLRGSNQFEAVTLNFMLKKLTLEVRQQVDKEELRGYIQGIVDDIERGVEIIYPKGKQQVALEQDDSQEHSHSPIHRELISLVASISLLLLGSVLKQDIFMIVAYGVVGYDVIWQAIKNLLKGRMLDENFLMTLATVAAFIIGEYPEAVAVMIFYKIGEYLQGRAVDYSTRQIEKAMDIRPDFARVIREKVLTVHPKEVKREEIIEVRPGEKIPLDGIVIKGMGTLDTSMLTGESLPVQVTVGDQVLSGSINQNSLLEVRVTEVFETSTVSKILELIQSASSKKSHSEQFITKFAKWYTPLVVLGALLVAIIPSIITGDIEHWVYTSIVFLVISCPCALVVSVPLGFFGGIGAASKQGVLVKGSNYLEELNAIDTIVLDKTGTITKGSFDVTHILVKEGSEEEILRLAAQLESLSNHPIARSIVKAYGKEKLEGLKVSDYEEVSGQGLVGKVKGESLLVGNEKLMKAHNLSVMDTNELGSRVHVAKNGRYLGCIIVADQVKEDSEKAIKALKARGIKKIIMLTGDRKEFAEYIGKQVGVDKVYAGLLPQDKVRHLEKELEEGKVAFVGDGINDAPVLARADIGIAMGGVGSDAAIEAADVVLMTDSLSSIGDVLDVAKRTRRVVTQNIIFALGIKVLILLLGLIGIANMWLAVFADVGVSLLAVINSMRILGKHQGFFIEALKKH
ncbi:cadmium-translocating P-type ATPase [Sporanaerobium hydrogeniformans]|uniref:Cadmium-translocating P-type ATPase n=1 Tax=Sporanaerobium hydrogeniformans TaxID=3072179 RepID=A0AC61DAV6_9FIRM|nr:heavy metal translocating P-type ATPase [Sporanaerobium hydrogeniformans]PHV69881.1 cadmium-translocating P-type ATPase [Sporanaerobium hydrogeniformans]